MEGCPWHDGGGPPRGPWANLKPRGSWGGWKRGRCVPSVPFGYSYLSLSSSFPQSQRSLRNLGAVGEKRVPPAVGGSVTTFAFPVLCEEAQCIAMLSWGGRLTPKVLLSLCPQTLLGLAQFPWCPSWWGLHNFCTFLACPTWFALSSVALA